MLLLNRCFAAPIDWAVSCLNLSLSLSMVCLIDCCVCCCPILLMVPFQTVSSAVSGSFGEKSRVELKDKVNKNGLISFLKFYFRVTEVKEKDFMSNCSHRVSDSPRKEGWLVLPQHCWWGRESGGKFQASPLRNRPPLDSMMGGASWDK